VPFTIIAVDPVTGRRGLLVEIYPDRAAGDKAALCADISRRLYDRSIRVGLVVTPEDTLLVRDVVSGVGFDENRFETRRLPTAELLTHAGLGAPRAGAAFCEQVRTWLEAIGTSWFSYLAPEAAAVMVPDVVGHLVHADLETWDGLLEQGDAA
jgi:hypothetical protein